MFQRLFSCVLFVCLLSTSSLAASAQLDLRDKNWAPGTIFDLNTEWDFYWQAFLDPQTLKDSSAEKTPEPTVFPEPIAFPVPAAWNKPPAGYPAFPGKGYASYHLRILVPPEIDDLFLSIPDMASAYRLYNNGILIASNGEIGRDKAEEKPAYQPKQVSLQPFKSAESGKLELVLQTSNFHYQWGGPWYPLRLTDNAGIEQLREKPIIQAMLSATILIAASLFALFMFSSRPKEKVLLYFSLLCLAMGLRRLLIDERILYFYVGDHWQLLQALENLCTYLSFPLFISYFSRRFPAKHSQLATRISWFIAAPFCLLAVTTEVDVYTRFNVPFQIIILISLPYIFYTFYQVIRERRFGASLFGLGLVIFIVTVINDILTYSYVINTPNLAHIGILAFVIFQGIDLAKSYLHNFETIEDLSITLQSQNRELIKIDNFKDEFLATTSHELRTPLHGIAGLARHLIHDRTLNLDSQQKHKLELIASSTQRLSALVNDILDFESIKHGQLKLYKKPVDLDALSRSVISTLKPLLEGRDIELSARIDDQARWVLADENRLQQILFNLLGNAIKFTEEGYIQLDSQMAPDAPDHPDQPMVCIEIRDTGTGISPDKLDVLFEPFQSQRTESDNYTSGSGLGLSICRQLVRQHGSDLQIDSQAGNGTRIYFTLPLVEVAHQPEPMTPSAFEDHIGPAQPAASATDSRLANTQKPVNRPQHDPVMLVDGALVFVVDDDEVNRELVRSQLEQADYVVECFGGGHALLDRLESRLPDLILLDLMMPMIGGLEVCQRIRQHHDSYELPIMMLTARYQVSDIVDCLSAGANDYLIKPYHEQELLARVYSQLKARHFWISHQENQVLKQEIDQRKQLQAELALANQRLLQALDIADESILLLNQQFAIIYANEAAANLYQVTTSALLQRSIDEVFSEDTYQQLVALSTSTDTEKTLTCFDQQVSKQLKLTLHPFQENNEQYYALVISQATDSECTASAHDKPANLLKELTDELARSRQKIDQIEHALKHVVSLPQQTQTEALATDNNTQPLNANNTTDELSSQRYRRELLVKVLRESLMLWETHTHKSKADLAEASRCWRVYLDGTTAKTRTLDRYLSERTLPEKPRWQLVVRTAKYVMDHVTLSSEENEKLEQMIDALDQAFS